MTGAITFKLGEESDLKQLAVADGLKILLGFGRSLCKDDCDPDIGNELVIAVAEWYDQFRSAFEESK